MVVDTRIEVLIHIEANFSIQRQVAISLGRGLPKKRRAR